MAHGLSPLLPDILVAVASGLLGWFGKTVLRALKGAPDREAEMHRQGWALAQERDREIVLLRGIVMRSFNREGAYRNAFECVLLILKLPVDEQAAELRKVRLTLERAVSSRAGGGA